MTIVTNIFIIINILLSGYYLYLHCLPFELGKIILGIVSILLIIVPLIIEKFCKLKIEKYIKTIYYFFLFIAFILGILFSFYYSTAYFDLIVHFLFGFFASIILSNNIKVSNWKKWIIVISCVLLLGFLWEFLEFLSDICFGTDHQRKISGATDTMTDLLISALGSFVAVGYFYFMNKIKNKLHNIIDIS